MGHCAAAGPPSGSAGANFSLGQPTGPPLESISRSISTLFQKCNDRFGLLCPFLLPRSHVELFFHSAPPFLPAKTDPAQVRFFPCENRQLHIDIFLWL